ncbi:MAG: gliding motility-associated C-terminal domain-containing protein [Saprospiraceae bacterium]|nr:gliding motility-associated C-terminal domain-containing protein [Saprospiraceae bacterium]
MKSIHFMVICIFCFGLNAQNLISNPGFEKCDRCGQFGNQGVELTLGNNSNNPVDWYGVTFGSADIRPDQARSGRYHGGFFSFGKFEYLGNVLNQPLIAGAEYEISCYLGTRSDSEYSTDEIGFCFQNGKNLYQIAGALDQLTPQVSTPDGGFLPFKSYQKYTMKFIACGGEDHLIIGRFKNLGFNDTLFVGTKRTSNLYTYTIIDDVELILTNPAPDFLPDEKIVCENSTFILQLPSGPVGRKVLWSTGETTERIVADAKEGLIWVEVRYGDLCSPIRDSVSIRVTQDEILSIDRELKICRGQSITLTRDSAGLVNPIWSHGHNYFSSSVDQSGEYILTSESACGMVRDVFRVIVEDSLRGKLFISNSVCFSNGLILSPAMADQGKWLWSTGDTSQNIMPSSGGIYKLSLTNNCGVLTDSVLVKDNTPMDSILMIPNTFTPNGDQLNDQLIPIFMPEKLSLIQDYKFIIFNRWGKTIFESTNPSEAWIPTENMAMESYIYSLELKANNCDNVTRQKKSGTVSLIR